MARPEGAGTDSRGVGTEHIDLLSGFYLSSVRRSDRDALVAHLAEPQIAADTLHIPHPYERVDAVKWIEERIAHRRGQKAEVTFAIRTSEGRLIGAIGADHLEVGSSHRANVGYWLARPYWGRGLMTEALGRYVRYAFARLEVSRLEAAVFPWNEASVRVLQKVGFRREGRLRNRHEKDGELVDALLYSLIPEDLED